MSKWPGTATAKASPYDQSLMDDYLKRLKSAIEKSPEKYTDEKINELIGRKPELKGENRGYLLSLLWEFNKIENMEIDLPKMYNRWNTDARERSKIEGEFAFNIKPISPHKNEEEQQCQQ